MNPALKSRRPRTAERPPAPSSPHHRGSRARCGAATGAGLLLALPALIAPADARAVGWLGVEVRDVERGSAAAARLAAVGEEGGVAVVFVAAGSPAAGVGLLRDDLIVSFGARKVRTVDELKADVAAASPGDRVPLGVLRGTRRATLYPIIAAPPAGYALEAGEPSLQVQPAESQLAALFPDASRFVRELRPVPHYRATKAGELLGIAFVTTEVCPDVSEGFRGPIATLVGVSLAGKIVGVKVLYQVESNRYTGDHLDQFTAQYANKDANDPFVIGGDVDAISGATVTSSAINRSIALGSSIVITAVLGTAPQRAKSRSSGLSWRQVAWNSDALLLLVIAAVALLGYFRGSQPVRFVALGMSLVFLGFHKGGGLSIHDAINLLEGHLPSLIGAVYWTTLVLFVLATALLIGRFYCGWLCPFGALSEMLYRARPRWRLELPLGVDQALRSLKYVVLVALLLVVVTAGQASLAGTASEVVEPFGTVFRLSGGLLAWLTAGVFLLGSLVICRPYCRYLCPLGALFALIAVVVSFARHALAGTRPGARHRGLTAAAGGCPMDAIRYERDGAEVGVRSGECIVCSPPGQPGPRG